MTTQANKQLVQQLAAASPREDIDRIAQILSPQLAWYPGGAREPYRIVDGRIVEAWNLDQKFLSQLR